MPYSQTEVFEAQWTRLCQPRPLPLGATVSLFRSFSLISLGGASTRRASLVPGIVSVQEVLITPPTPRYLIDV